MLSVIRNLRHQSSSLMPYSQSEAATSVRYCAGGRLSGYLTSESRRSRRDARTAPARRRIKAPASWRSWLLQNKANSKTKKSRNEPKGRRSQRGRHGDRRWQTGQYNEACNSLIRSFCRSVTPATALRLAAILMSCGNHVRALPCSCGINARIVDSIEHKPPRRLHRAP